MAEPARKGYVGLNGALLGEDAARISPLGEGFLYGRGLFETIKVSGGRPAFFPEHAERLRRGCAELGLGGPSPAAELRSRCGRVIAANGLGEGSLKVVVFAEAGGTGELITARGNAYQPDQYERGFALMSVPGGRGAGGLAGLKSLNYLGNLVARRAAQASGFDEALFVGADGSVLEGAATNVFVVSGGRVLTPPPDGSILPGIVRGRLLALAPAPGIREERIAAAQLPAADEVFVTNSLLGVMPVARVDRRAFDLGRNPVTRSLMAAYRAAELESLAPGSP